MLLASDEAGIAGRQCVLLLRDCCSYIWLQQRARSWAIVRRFLLGGGLSNRVKTEAHMFSMLGSGSAAIGRYS